MQTAYFVQYIINGKIVESKLERDDDGVSLQEGLAELASLVEDGSLDLAFDGYPRMTIKPSGFRASPVLPSAYEGDDNERGLYNKYLIARADGEPLAPNSKFFVLRYDEGCNVAWRKCSAEAIKAFSDQADALGRFGPLSEQLLDIYAEIAENPF